MAFGYPTVTPADVALFTGLSDGKPFVSLDLDDASLAFFESHNSDEVREVRVLPRSDQFESLFPACGVSSLMIIGIPQSDPDLQHCAEIQHPSWSPLPPRQLHWKAMPV